MPKLANNALTVNALNFCPPTSQNRPCPQIGWRLGQFKPMQGLVVAAEKTVQYAESISAENCLSGKTTLRNAVAARTLRSRRTIGKSCREWCELDDWAVDKFCPTDSRRKIVELNPAHQRKVAATAFHPCARQAIRGGIHRECLRSAVKARCQ